MLFWFPSNCHSTLMHLLLCFLEIYPCFFWHTLVLIILFLILQNRLEKSSLGWPQLCLMIRYGKWFANKKTFLQKHEWLNLATHCKLGSIVPQFIICGLYWATRASIRFCWLRLCIMIQYIGEGSAFLVFERVMENRVISNDSGVFVLLIHHVLSWFSKSSAWKWKKTHKHS